ncbi:MAG TPA: YqcC family protein [Verrucomicrobiae bacterium]|jgi:uncharacterized protein YqcC (DUF446 family)|nr:YqcC family protein [Verrucomicrobiae bacterium]
MQRKNVAAAAGLLDRIESELKRINYWQSAPLPKEKFADMGAFGMNTMAFSQWLQFVFLPQARKAVSGERELPTSSDVSVQGVREFDGDPNAGNLVSLLCEFDALVNGQ